MLAALDDGALLETADGLVWSAVAMTLQLCGSARTAEFAEQARSIAYRRGSTFATGCIEQWRGFHLLSSDLAEAGDALRQAVALQATWGTDVRGGTWGRAYLCQYTLAIGDVHLAREALGPAPDEHDASDGANVWRAAAGELALAERRWDDALALARRVEHAAPHNVNPDWKPWRSVAARALAGLGRRAEALTTMGEELEVARRVASDATVGRCLRELGELEGEDGVERLRAAVATLEPTPARLELARALVALGARLVADGGRDEAVVALLLRGRDLAQACGSPPLVAAAERELASAGVGDPPSEHGTAALTAQEHRIAKLAAAGHSDRDIAFELLLTPEAVDRHVARACAKLAVVGREELRAALDGQAATPPAPGRSG
jgi:DNA-binding CsgD family transcriptional regulator